MIHLFNRKRLLTTFSLEEQDRVRSVLAQKGIDYRVKASCPTARATAFGASGRSRLGSFGVDSASAYQYDIYVRKADYPKAQSLI